MKQGSKWGTAPLLVLGGLGGYAAIRLAHSPPTRSLPPDSRGKRVVILGAGFAGLAAASALADQTHGQLRITLLDQNNFHLFTPMLYQVATCAVEPHSAAVPLRPLAPRRGIEFVSARVTGVDPAQHTINTASGGLTYDYLVIALGSTTSFFGNASAQRHALPLKSLEDGVATRDHVIDCLERAARETDALQRRALLTILVIGGGATGVETAGSMRGILEHVIARDYPALHKDELRVMLVEAGPKLLGHMPAAMAKLAASELRRAGVEILLNSKAAEVSPSGLRLEDGQTVAARTVIWATGVHASEIVSGLDLPHGPGGSLLVNRCLQTAPFPEVFAIGDNAHVENAPVPLLAATAVQQGEWVAANILRLLRSEPPRPFHYKDLGNVVSIGHRSGVARFGSHVIGGFAAWLAWRAVHLARITTFRNKLLTTLDWTMSYLYDIDTARVRTPGEKAA